MTKSLRGIDDASVKALNSGVQGREGNWIRLPNNYFNNLKVYNGDNTQVRYLPGRSNSWSNYQEDEILCIGAYDFAFRLPPVPFFLNDTATTEIYTLSLHDALPF